MLISSRSVNKHGLHRQLLFLIGRFYKIFSSQTAYPNEPKLGRKQLWKVFYKDCTFHPGPLTNMVATDISKIFDQHPGYFKAVFSKQTWIIIVSIYKYAVYIMFWIYDALWLLLLLISFFVQISFILQCEIRFFYKL